MKYLIVLFTCLVSVDALLLTNEQKFKVRNDTLVCMKQEKITEQQGEALREFSFDKADDKVKCFTNCFLERTGFIADGKIQPDVEEMLSPIFGSERIKTVQAKCNSLKGADNCDTAFRLYRCYHELLV